MGSKLVRVWPEDIARLDRIVSDLAVATRGAAVARLLDFWEEPDMAKRQIGPGPRPVEQPEAPPVDVGSTLVPARDVDVWRGALQALDTAREAIRACAVYAATRPGQAHQGAVEALGAGIENIGAAATAITRARAEIEAAEWQHGASR